VIVTYIARRLDTSIFSDQLQPFSGVYKSTDGAKIVIDIEGNRLMVTNPEGSRDHFKAVSETKYFRKGWYVTILFDTKGPQTKMTVSFFDGELGPLKVE